MLNAERYYMTAPIYADTPELREVLINQPFYTSVRDLILASDVACFAASEMSEASLLIRLGPAVRHLCRRAARRRRRGRCAGPSSTLKDGLLTTRSTNNSSGPDQRNSGM